MDEEGKLSSFSGKVCLVCRFISKKVRDDSGRDRLKGYHISVVNLSDIVDGYKKDLKLQPDMLVEIEGSGGLGIAMQVCGIDSQVYFVDHTRWSNNRTVYFLDIQHQQYKRLSASQLPTLPPMSGFKNMPVITPIPTTKRLLVFSTFFLVAPYFDPVDGHSDNDNDNDDDSYIISEDYEDYDDPIDFEMYDVETKSWKTLPQLVIREGFHHGYPNKMGPCYFLHGSATDKEGTLIPINRTFSEFEISHYSFIHKDTLLVTLNWGRMPMLTLDLNSPSKGWRVYNEVMVTNPNPISSTENVIGVEDKHQRRWCADHDIGAAACAVRFPQSEFEKAKPVPVRSLFGSKFTPLEDEKHVCIAHGDVDRKSKVPHLTMDVVDVHNLVTSVASSKFDLHMYKCKDFLPCCIFVYHPQQEDTQMQVQATQVFPEDVDKMFRKHGIGVKSHSSASSGSSDREVTELRSELSASRQQQAELQACVSEQRKEIEELRRQLALMKRHVETD